VIVVAIILSSSLVAALWGWRLEAVKTDRLKCDVEMERINAAKWIELHGRKCEELTTLAEQQKIAVTDLLDARAKLRESRDRCETLSNHVDSVDGGMEIMQQRIKAYEAAEEKRREQKRIGMQRYRANKKKGAKK